MANNAFSKEEIVFFDQVQAGFDPNNITARQVMKYQPPSTQFERSALEVFRPVPYISVNKDGLVLSSVDFADTTQLSVPSTLNANNQEPSDIKNVPFIMNAVELNDPLQLSRKALSAVQALSALVDRAIAIEVATRGTLFIADNAPITKYNQIAKAEEAMSIRDVPIMAARTLIMNPVDYNGVSGDLANRDAPPTGVSLTAFERSRIPTVATFDSFKANFMPTQEESPAKGESYLINGANEDHDPVATDANGNNVDNRTQLLNVDGGSIKPQIGDAFTIANVNSIGLINKNSSGIPQTFRIVGPSVTGPSITRWEISPAIIAADGGGQANKEYANVDSIPADDAAITFLNRTTKPSNIFFMNDAVEIVHGSLATMELDGSGVSTMRRTTDSGIEILFAKGANIRDLGTEYRLTIWFAPNVLIPDMCGNLVGSQV